ncbi:lymphocyte cytosolic protein 2a [Aplochiton taeniatus]
MSFDRLPSKSEVMGWNPHILADYMKKMDLPGCDKVILRNSMSGSRFLNMSENDLQNFPKVHAPLISKICREINRKEEKRGIFGKRPTVPKYHQPETPSEGPGWDPDEFDTDDDYESPDDNVDRGSVGDYESPSEEIENEGGASDNDYEPPPSEPLEEMSLQMRAGLPMGNSHYIVHTAPPAPPVDRKKKPTTLERGLNHSPSQGACPLDLAYLGLQGFLDLQNTLTASSTQYGQDMDTRWYMGLVKRGQAEGCLRQVNKDGAYLVRDSSTQSWEQPFTLMVLYQDKVYNIQIRRQENQYLLGTGLKAAETFPSVPDMIKHYSQSPLLLIDAKNRGLGQQNQCLLIYPAGY